MFLEPAWRTRIFTAVAVVVAVWLGWAIAEGDSLATLCAVVLGGFVVTRLIRLSLGTALLGLILFGYIIGNRGFAQISVSNFLPILPAEAVLAVAGTLLCIQSAWRHELPLRRDPLNFAILLWMILGTIRVGFDVRLYGFMAVRDYATVYYAAFFYLAQAAGRDPAERAFLVKVIVVSCGLLLPITEIYNQFPAFFLGTLTLRGVPLIFYKGDLVGTFLAVGSVLFFLRYEENGRKWNVAVSLLLGLGVLASTNRASMLGLFLATVWLLAGRRWRFAAVQATAGAIAVALILLGATVLNISWEKTPVYGLYERAVSVIDVSGQRTYRSADSLDKGDNNIFRRVWWGAVLDETFDGNPYIGLGFGHDLAERFAREYYADTNEEFSTRSPHNILLTIFARMGAVGLIAFLVVVGLIARRTWWAIRRGPTEAALWCSAWVMLASACLGVVLEGPMGAVVFWSVLGLANVGFLEEKAEDLAWEDPAVLHPGEPANEVPAAP